MTEDSVLKKWYLVFGGMLLGIILMVGVMTTARADSQSSLQRDFQKAAEKYQVPVKVLMAVSYNETRFENHNGKPSVAGGYGVMHLTDAASGDVSNAGKTTQSIPNTAVLHTLNKAAALTGISVTKLKTNDAANIAGGAALLADYQKKLGYVLSSDLNLWYGAVEKYSQDTTEEAAAFFADNVYRTIKTGVTKNGVTIAAQSVAPVKSQSESLKLVSMPTTTDGPEGLPIEWVPALYKEFDSQGDYGNYDLADRPNDGLKINYIVIHNTETTFDEATNLFASTPSYTSANYVISSEQGTIAEMVKPQNVAWHAGNWYINSHSIGIEHEGYAAVGGYWFTEAMYRSSAALVKYLAAKYHIPLDRQHIIGHDNVPGLTPANQKTMHWDPGTYWNWQHYFELLGVNFKDSQGDGNVVTITPDPAHNLTTDSGQTVTDDGVSLPLKGSNFVYLYKQPSFDSELIADKDFSNSTVGTTEKDDWADKAVTGQQFYKVGQSGDWTEIDYGGQAAWFYNPDNANTTAAAGKLVTPKNDKAIPVYGSAYPDNSILKKNKVTGTKATPLYEMPAGQKYVFGGEMTADYFNSHFNSNTAKNVIKENTKYVQVQFNHRIGFVKATDVDVVDQ
ncbi:N-acetylmuramoyl-L-alanine amidase [Lentilactobacillus farraginis]|uniref:N-acetylmuramoyl-L-alanine amidase n=1 Tax=Lentilactobacillus farraginis TaxID=390841 RepID=UPI001F3F87AE|nr:N-acetylmuramoyl-L-alanine amidase [Lentilactobacillus farraginis]